MARLERYEEAVEDYSTVISLDPHNSHAFHNRGISLDKLGHFDAAIADFTKVLEIDSRTSAIDREQAVGVHLQATQMLEQQQQLQQQQQQQQNAEGPGRLSTASSFLASLPMQKPVQQQKPQGAGGWL